MWAQCPNSTPRWSELQVSKGGVVVTSIRKSWSKYQVPKSQCIYLKSKGNMKVIVNSAETVMLPWEEGLLEWLQECYPYSNYQVVELVQTA
jgi:hypothetical protein